MRPLKLAAVLVCAAAQAWAVQAHAAVVIQTKAFSHLQQVLATYDEDSDLFSDQLAQASGSGATAVGFDAFDPDLGTLTDVRLVLSSVQRFHYGASVLGQGLIGLFDGRYIGAVNVGGQAVGGSSGFSSGPLGFCVPEVGYCQVAGTFDRAFGFDVAGLDPSAFLTSGDVDLHSTITLTDYQSFLSPGAFLTEFGVLGWNGTLSLHYTYSPSSVAAPAGIPEPATWGLMIAGFGLAGAALRRRRAPGCAVRPGRAGTA